MNKLVLSGVLLFASVALFAQDLEYPDSLPINQIKVLGSHNSYRRMTDSGILKFIHLADPFFKKTFLPHITWNTTTFHLTASCRIMVYVVLNSIYTTTPKVAGITNDKAMRYVFVPPNRMWMHCCGRA